MPGVRSPSMPRGLHRAKYHGSKHGRRAKNVDKTVNKLNVTRILIDT